MNELKNRWGDRDFFLFFIVLSACIVADYLIVRYYERKNREDETVTDELQHGSGFLLISYCLLAGYFGSLAFLFLKSFTEFIGSSASSKENSQANAANWYVYHLYHAYATHLSSFVSAWTNNLVFVVFNKRDNNTEYIQILCIFHHIK